MSLARDQHASCLMPTTAGEGGLSHSHFIHEDLVPEPRREDSPGLCVQLVQGISGSGFELGSLGTGSTTRVAQAALNMESLGRAILPVPTRGTSPHPPAPLAWQEAGHVARPLTYMPLRGKGPRFSPAFLGKG